VIHKTPRYSGSDSQTVDKESLSFPQKYAIYFYLAEDIKQQKRLYASMETDYKAHTRAYGLNWCKSSDLQ